MDKKVVYIDMDGVLVDLVGAVYEKYIHALGEDGFDVGAIIDQDVEPFYKAAPMPGAVEAFKQLSNDPRFDVYILSTAPWTSALITASFHLVLTMTTCPSSWTACFGAERPLMLPLIDVIGGFEEVRSEKTWKRKR